MARPDGVAVINWQSLTLGNPKNAAETGAKGAVTQRAEADAFTANISPLVRQTSRRRDDAPGHR